MSTEEQRYKLQVSLDATKSQQQRNELGQFSTPYKLACQIVDYALQSFPDENDIEMIEPACGTGVFFSAMESALGPQHIKGSVGYELDLLYQKPSADLWRSHGVEIKCADFLKQEPDRQFRLLIANPPYTRHHHIPSEMKHYLQAAVKNNTGLTISGLAGLYCYFILLSTTWLVKDGLACWLIPSEFMDVNYGEAVRRFLLEKVDLLRIHRFNENDLQFDDALVTSSVVFFRNSPPSVNPVAFTYSGTIGNPESSYSVAKACLAKEKKWNHFFKPQDSQSSAYSEVLGDFFEVKRGIATGCNDFFIVGEDTISRYEIPEDYLTPILPSPRLLKTDRIASDNGKPLLDNPLFLFSSDEDLNTIRQKHPLVAKYIDKGVSDGVNESYICSRHNPWYSCEKRLPAPFVIPYMGRNNKSGRMFRFILNESKAIATNGYLLLYPKKEYAYLFKSRQLLLDIWKQLNNIPVESFERQGRFYGGGLHKLEPRELLMLPVADIAKVLGNHIQWVA